MVDIYDEQAFYGRNGSAFEAYMFATADKHIVRHEDFSDMEITVMVRDRKRTFKDDAVLSADGRRSALTFFNKYLKDVGGLDILKNANKLDMGIIYFDMPDDNGDRGNWHQDYLEVKSAIFDFCKAYNKVIAVATHFHQQMNDGSGGMTYPHIHYIYAPDRNGVKLSDYLLSLSD